MTTVKGELTTIRISELFYSQIYIRQILHLNDSDVEVFFFVWI